MSKHHISIGDNAKYFQQHMNQAIKRRMKETKKNIYLKSEPNHSLYFLAPYCVLPGYRRPCLQPVKRSEEVSGYSTATHNIVLLSKNNYNYELLTSTGSYGLVGAALRISLPSAEYFICHGSSSLTTTFGTCSSSFSLFTTVFTAIEK